MTGASCYTRGGSHEKGTARIKGCHLQHVEQTPQGTELQIKGSQLLPDGHNPVVRALRDSVGQTEVPGELKKCP